MTPASLSALAKGDIANFITASTEGGIERQEKAGQIEESFKETLPIDLRPGREIFEKLGFVFGSNADDIFVNVKFPEGWRKSPTRHSMWTDILDAKARKRGSIFYKAAFYDRSAHGNLSRRFGISQTYDDPRCAFVTDACGEVKREVNGLPDETIITNREEKLAAYKKFDEAKKELQEWLNENYPQWEDVAAYW